VPGSLARAFADSESTVGAGTHNLAFGVLPWTGSPRRDRPRESVGCDARVVISKTAVASETDRRMPHIWIRIGDDARRLRIEAGVSGEPTAVGGEARR
jgi:hypothetical protein